MTNSIKTYTLLFFVFPLTLFFLCSCFSKDENKSHTRKTIMVFSPHQDDEANMANAVMYSRAKQGADVYVVIGFGSVIKNNDTYGLLRLRQSANNLKCLGLCPTNLIYLGYQCLSFLPVITTNSLGEIIKTNKTIFNTFSHPKEGFPSFHSVKYGQECSQSEEHLLSDIVDILLQYKPDEIYAINYDDHPDHIWMGSLVEQALGLVKLQDNYDDYCPRFYQSMSYQSSWRAKRDMMSVFSPNDLKRNILESTLYFIPRNTTFQWNERVRFPVDDRMSVPNVNSNLSTLAIISSFSEFVDKKRLLGLVNGDQIFWERDTRNKSFRASVSVSSNEADKRYLNDFSITCVPLKSICKMWHTWISDDKIMFDLYDCYKWSPEINDTNKFVTLKFYEPLDIDSVRLYDDLRLENHITSGLLTFSDGSSLEVGALNNCGSATIINFKTKKRITFVRFQIKEYIGTPGLSEFEVYAPRSPRPPDFIQIFLSAANNEKWPTKSFLYDYPVDVSQQSQTVQLSVYRYPNEVANKTKWQIEGKHKGIFFDTSGVLHIEQSTLPGKYTVKASEGKLIDAMTINVINNHLTDKKVQNTVLNINDELKKEESNVETHSEQIPVNLILNSDFSEGLKGWRSTKGVKVIEEEGRKCVEFLGQENDQVRIWQNINTTSGHVYRLTFKVKALQNTAFAIFRDTVTGKEKYLLIDPLDDWNKKSKSFESKHDGVYSVFLSCRGKGTFYYSDISLIDVTTSENRQQ